MIGAAAPRTCLFVVLVFSYFGGPVYQFQSTENGSALNNTYSKGQKIVILAAPWDFYTNKNLNMKRSIKIYLYINQTIVIKESI